MSQMWTGEGGCPRCGGSGSPCLWDGFDPVTHKRIGGMALLCDCDEWPAGLTEADKASARQRGHWRRRKRTDRRIILRLAAQVAGVDVLAYSRYEQGKADLTEEQEGRLAAIFAAVPVHQRSPAQLEGDRLYGGQDPFE